MKSHSPRLIIQLINIVQSIFIGFLLIRFFLRLFGASESAPFVHWIYETSFAILSPFEGAFPSPTFQQGVILEFSTLFAILIYAVVAWLLIELVRFVYKTRGAHNDPLA